MIKEYTKVKTLVEKDGFPAGTIGIVVSLHESGPACEVELWNSDSYPIDVVTYTFDELEAIGDGSESNEIINSLEKVLINHQVALPDPNRISFSSIEELNGWGNDFDGEYLSIILI